MFAVGRRLVTATMMTMTLGLSLPALAINESYSTASTKAELQQRLAAMQNLTADFEQTVRSDNGDVLQQLTGELVIQRPNKMRWKTNPPDDTLMVANGESVWYYNPFVEQVTIYQQSDATANSPMLLLLTGTNEQWQNYQVTEQSKGTYQVTAIDGSRSLTLAFTDNTLSDIGLQQAQGDTIDIRLEQVQLNTGTPASTFEFSIPSGTDIDDQR